MAKGHHHASPEARQAHSVCLHTCSHGTTFLHLFDDTGQPFAVASFTKESLARFVIEAMEELSPGALAKFGPLIAGFQKPH